MPTINGREYQHATLSVNIAGLVDLVTFKKISYKHTAEKKPVTNAQGITIGFTIDNEKIDASMSMLLSEWFRMKDVLAQIRPDLGIGQMSFDMTVTYGNTLNVMKTDRLYGVMFNEEPRDSSDSQEALVVDLPLFVFDLRDSNGARFVSKLF